MAQVDHNGLRFYHRAATEQQLLEAVATAVRVAQTEQLEFNKELKNNVLTWQDKGRVARFLDKQGKKAARVWQMAHNSADAELERLLHGRHGGFKHINVSIID